MKNKITKVKKNNKKLILNFYLLKLEFMEAYYYLVKSNK